MNEARFWICWGLSLPGRPIAEPMPALRSEHFATSFFVFLSVIVRHGVAKTASGGPKTVYDDFTCEQGACCRARGTSFMKRCMQLASRSLSQALCRNRRGVVTRCDTMGRETATPA